MEFKFSQSTTTKLIYIWWVASYESLHSQSSDLDSKLQTTMAATLVEKILVVPLLFGIVARVLLSIPEYPFRGKDGATTLSEHILCTAFLSVFSYLSIGQLQYVERFHPRVVHGRY